MTIIGFAIILRLITTQYLMMMVYVFKHSLIAGPEDGQAGHGLWSRDHERQEAFFRTRTIPEFQGSRSLPTALPAKLLQKDQRSREDQSDKKVVLVSDDPDWDLFVENTIANGIQSSNDFKAGKINECLTFWKFIELDGKIVQGQNRVEPYFFLPSKTQKINVEIQKMLKKGIVCFTPSPDNYVSPIFSREKSDGNLRVILDLSEFNKNVTLLAF